MMSLAVGAGFESLGVLCFPPDLALTVAKINYPNEHFVQLQNTGTVFGKNPCSYLLSTKEQPRETCNQIGSFHSPSV